MDCSVFNSEDQASLMQVLLEVLGSDQTTFSAPGDENLHFGSDTPIDFDQVNFFNDMLSLDSVLPLPDRAHPVTTLMVRNIPRKCTQRMLMSDLIAAGFGHLVDFVYLPTDISSARNLGYAFVNCIRPEHAMCFRDAFHKKHLMSMRGSRAGLSVSFAVIQGLDANVANVMKTAAVHRIRNPEYLPLILNKSEGKLVPCYMTQSVKRRDMQSSMPPQMAGPEVSLFDSHLNGGYLKAH